MGTWEPGAMAVGRGGGLVEGGATALDGSFGGGVDEA
jgi:hypothetical protein